jgi:hypothetical protein
MNQKFHFPILIVTILLCAGCISRKDPIELNDNFQAIEKNSFAAPPKEAGLEKSELAQIEQEVFSHLLSRNLGDDGHFSAVFMTADESQTDALQKKFPRHVPPLKNWWHLDQPPGQSPLDLDTGRPALVLSADVADPENGTVVAIGKWFAGPAVSGFYTFEFKRNGAAWIIQSVK